MNKTAAARVTCGNLAGAKPEFPDATSGDKIFRRKIQATANLPFNAPGAK